MDDYLDGLVEGIKKLDGPDVQIVLRQYYETKMCIFDHMNTPSDRPMATVALYDSVENSRTSLLRKRFEQYVKSNVFKYTGMSPLEFFSMPREYTTWLFEICEQKTIEDSKGMAKVQEELDLLKRN